MQTIMINCPTTGRPVSTGILTQQTDFSRLSHLPGIMHCPCCGEYHQWSMSYAWLAPASMANVAPAEAAESAPISST